MDRYGCESQPAFLKIGGEIPALKDTLHVADLPIDVKAFWICDAFGCKLRKVDATSTIDVSDFAPRLLRTSNGRPQRRLASGQTL